MPALVGALLLPLVSFAAASGTTYDRPYATTTAPATMVKHTFAVQTTGCKETGLRSMASGQVRSFFLLSHFPIAAKSLPARLPAGANNAPLRLTQAGDEFIHYGYAEHAAGWQAGARPGTFAGTIKASTGAEAQSIYNLPRWRSPPDAYYVIRPSAETPIQGPGRVMPAYGRDVPGLSEFVFPQGTLPGTVSGPFPLPAR